MFDLEHSALQAYLALLEVSDQALCAEVDPELWFPEKGGSSAAAKTLCFACPIREACLAYAMTTDEIGIWGGTSANDRRQLGVRHRRRGAGPLTDGRRVTAFASRVDISGTYRRSRRPERAA